MGDDILPSYVVIISLKNERKIPIENNLYNGK